MNLSTNKPKNVYSNIYLQDLQINTLNCISDVKKSETDVLDKDYNQTTVLTQNDINSFREYDNTYYINSYKLDLPSNEDILEESALLYEYIETPFERTQIKVEENVMLMIYLV
jgi:hypothetical protein